MSGQSQGFFSKLTGSVSQAGGIMNTFRGILAGVSGAFSAFFDLIGQTWQKIKSMDFSGAFGLWADAGSKIASGFSKGYNDKINTLKKEQLAKEIKDQEEANKKKTEKEGKPPVAPKGDKGKSSKKTEYDLAKEEYELTKKNIDLKLEQQQIDDDSLRKAQGRTQNIYDELTVNEQKKKALLDEQTAYEKIGKLIQYNSEGKAIGIKGIKKEDFAKVYTDYLAGKQKIEKDISSNDDAAVKLKAKISLDPLESEKLWLDKKKAVVEAKIKLGAASQEDLIPVLRDEIELAQKYLDNAKSEEEKLRVQIGVVAGPLSAAEQKSLEDAGKAVEDANAKVLNTKIALYNEEKALEEKRL